MKISSRTIIFIVLVAIVASSATIRNLQEQDDEISVIYGQYDLLKDFVRPKETKYYLIQFQDAPTVFDIAVTVLSGSVNVFVDKDTNQKPS